MAVIEIKDLKKYFGKTKAVDGISFKVEKGEVFGFLGPNGAGKTTTIRCIMDFVRPSHGNIKIFGLDSTKESVKIKEKIGYLSGNLDLYDYWTGKDHIDFIQSIRGKSIIVNNLIKKLDFDQKIKFRALSSGNRRKLGLILALMYQPGLIILDEPTVGLDPLLQNIIYQTLEEFQKNGSTIFMSSHNLPEVDRICDHVAIIKEGKLVATEDIQSLKNKKMHTATIHFGSDFKKSDFIFDGVEVQEELPERLVLSIKGDINPLLNKLSNYKIKDLEITHASLEEIFLEFYERK